MFCLPENIFVFNLGMCFSGFKTLGYQTISFQPILLLGWLLTAVVAVGRLSHSRTTAFLKVTFYFWLFNILFVIWFCSFTIMWISFNLSCTGFLSGFLNLQFGSFISLGKFSTVFFFFFFQILLLPSLFFPYILELRLNIY